MNVETGAFLDQAQGHLTSQHLLPPRQVRTPHDDVSHAVRAREVEDGVHRILAATRTTSAPSSRAFSMLVRRWRCASASMRSGVSSGVSTYTTNQSVL